MIAFWMITLLLLLGALCFLAWKYWLLLSDLESLSHASVNLLRVGETKSYHFKYPKVQLIWRKLVSFNAGINRMLNSKDEALKLLSDSPMVSSLIESEKMTVKSFCDLLQKTLDPAPSMLAFISETDGDFKIQHTKGVYGPRVEGPIGIVLSNLDMGEDQECWYSSHGVGPHMDFSGLGILSSLFYKINQEGFPPAYIWLGFENKRSIEDVQLRDAIVSRLKQLVATLIFSREISEKLVEQNKKQDVLLGMSHDLKAPSTRALYAIQELVNRKKLSIDDQVLLEDIESALAEQLRLIDSVFNPELENNNSFEGESPLQLRECVEDRVESYRVLASAVGVELVLGRLDSALVLISSDSILRVLDNLLTNAIRHSHGQKVEVSVIADSTEVRIDVCDYGSGVPLSIRDTLFSVDVRSSTSRSSEGSGYGLVVSSNLISHFGGKISYSPNEPQGSLFSVTLPRSDRQIAKSETPDVCIIDDDPVILRAHVRWLSDLTPDVVSYSTFREGLNSCLNKVPCLIVCDATVPGDDIDTFLTNIHRDSKVILLSGKDSISLERIRSRYSNIIEVCQKPVTRSKFRNLVRLHLIDIKGGLSNAA